MFSRFPQIRISSKVTTWTSQAQRMLATWLSLMIFSTTLLGMCGSQARALQIDTETEESSTTELEVDADTKPEQATEPKIKAPFKYYVDLEEAKNHYIEVTMEVEAVGDSTELMMAVWTPGSYLVREYAKHLDTMRATNEKGEPLQFRKTRKNRWYVENGKAKTVVVSYRLYCNQVSVRTNYVGHEYAILNGAPTFLTVVGYLDHAHEVTLGLPKTWKRSATSLHTFGDQAHQYVAESFDELVDSPIVAGNLQVYPFNVGGVDHQLVNVGEAGYWDGSKAAADLKKVVAAHHEMWGVIPYDRYLFLNIIGGGGGGLEHNNSTLVMTSRWSFRDAGRYKSWLSLCSHEFFHTWNVRRLRPRPLMKYDYENEVYTDGLWIAEGITSYYEDLALVRAGIFDANEFMRRLNSNMSSVYRGEGRKVQSLRDSSFDTWIKFYRPDENSPNTSISYYSKGAVVAFLLDAKIRKLTDNKKSLDDVLRTMFENYSASGFTRDEFREAASEVAGADLGPWFENAIDSTNELEYDDSLTYLGVEIPAAAKKAKETGQKTGAQGAVSGVVRAARKAMASGNGSDPRTAGQRRRSTERSGTPWVGAQTSSGRVLSVELNSPAYELGINSGDEILAVNGLRLGGSLSERLRQFKVGDKVELLISRNDRLSKVDIELGQREFKSWSLGWARKLSGEQTLRRSQWLGIEMPKPTKPAKKDSKEPNGESEPQNEPKAQDGKSSKGDSKSKPKSEKRKKSKSKSMDDDDDRWS